MTIRLCPFSDTKLCDDGVIVQNRVEERDVDATYLCGNTTVMVDTLQVSGNGIRQQNPKPRKAYPLTCASWDRNLNYCICIFGR
jgi:hypothetical protein